MFRMLVVILLTAALASVAASAAFAGKSEPQWKKALMARSEALNAQYRKEPDWMKALRLRSEGLNARYGLGGATPVAAPAVVSDPAEDGFAWDAAMIGASSMVIISLLVGGSLLTVRHLRRRPLVH